MQKIFLILQNELKEFKNFTFWSEHLILHTVRSLRKILNLSGLKILISVSSKDIIFQII